MNRWLASRWMLIGAALCVLSYVPALTVGGEWVAGFFTIAGIYLGTGMGKNALDEWGRTRRMQFGTDAPPVPSLGDDRFHDDESGA